MDPQEIKDRLKAKGVSQNGLARKWGMPSCTINMLVNRKFKSARLEKRLARLLGVTPEELRNNVREVSEHQPEQ